MSEQIRILHVDDEPEFADVTATFLEREKDRFSVETATDAEEGLELLEENEYDCIVSDYDMPKKDGIEFLQSVREDRPALPFILFTGKGSEEVASDAVSAGVTDYLQKESGTEQYELLANRIENAVQARRNAERAARQDELMRLTEVAGNTGGFEIDLETGNLLLTRGARRITGVPEGEDFCLEEAIESYHPDDRERVRVALERVIETGEEIQEVFRSQVGEDGERLLELTMKPVTEDGGVTRIRGAVNDITDQRERQHELEQIESLFENAQDTLFLIDVGEGFVIERMNPAFEDATGLSPEEVRGREVRDIFGEDGAEMEERYTRCVEKEEPLEYEEQVRLDGEPTYWETRIAPVVIDGSVEYIAGATREVTERKERQRDLRRTKERLNLAVEGASLGVWDWDIESGEIEHNERWAEMLGLPPEDGVVSTESIQERIHPEDAHRMEEATEMALTGGKDLYDVELRARTTNGDRRWIRTVGQVVERDEDGRATRAVGVNIDIDERKRRKKELEKYRTFVESSPDVVTHVNEEGTVLYQSPATEDVFGYEKDGLVGENAFEYAHPDDRERIAGEFYATLEDPEDDSGKVEYRARCADGEYLWVEGFGVDQRETDAGGVVINQRDISERKRREKEIERQNDLFAKAQDIATVGAWEHDPGGEGLRWTDQVYEMHGISRDFEPSTESVLGLYHPEDRPKLREAVDAATTEGEPYDLEVRMTARDDGDRWIRTVADPQTENGTLVRVRGIIHDITERKERERRLRQQNERLEEFASVVSHDLRNPLNVAEGRLELAKEDCDSGHLDDVDGALERMEALIEDILTLAREGSDVGEIEPVETEEILEECWGNVETGTATLVNELGGKIEADPSRLRQLLENLFGNAVEHGGDDVTVTVGELDGREGFYVADDGEGIPEDERDSVFETGYSTSEEGTGFGLRIVRQIVQAHGWDIEVTESEAGGARFEVSGVGMPEA